MNRISELEKSASDSSVGADEKRTSENEFKQIIANGNGPGNGESVNNSSPVPVSSVDISNQLQTVSLTELYDTVYPPKTVIVDGFLYGGTYLFVGAPKTGKSFFMAQLAYHVALGKDLWSFNVRRGTVLYLALEDDYSRLQQRIFRMYGVEGSGELFFATKARMLSEGLEKQLENFIAEHPDLVLIIVDTLQKVREAAGEKYSYASDYEVVTKLKDFSDRHHLCILVVHHTRKMEAEDSFEMISGTNGLLGAADGAFVLVKKKRTDNEATLDVVGRDQQDQRLSLVFDRDHCTWGLSKMETELWKPLPDPVLLEISKFINKENEMWQGSATELLEKIPAIDKKPNSLTKHLNANAARLLDEFGICYIPCDRKREKREFILKMT